MTEPDMIAWIDSATTEELLRKWRFAPAGDPMCAGMNGVRLSRALRARKQADPEGFEAISKKVGWKFGYWKPANVHGY